MQVSPHIPNAAVWARFVRILSVLSLILGIVFLGLSFYWRAPNWIFCAISVFIILISVFGLYTSSMHTKPTIAFSHFLVLVVSFVIIMILLMAEISVVNDLVNSFCNDSNLPDDECLVYRSFRWFLAVISLIAMIPSCFCYIFFSYGFYAAVYRENSSRIDKMKNTLGIDRTSSDGSDQSLLGRM